MVVLLKPQYERERGKKVKGVLTESESEKVKDGVVGRLRVLGYRIWNLLESPILGGSGNREYLLLLNI